MEKLTERDETFSRLMQKLASVGAEQWAIERKANQEAAMRTEFVTNLGTYIVTIYRGISRHSNGHGISVADSDGVVVVGYSQEGVKELYDSVAEIVNPLTKRRKAFQQFLAAE